MIFLIQLDDAVYAKLKKDADDNRQIIGIMRIVLLTIVLLIAFFCWGRPMLDLDIQRRQANLEREMALTNAETSVEIREIESKGLSFDDYICWLNAREKD